MLVIDPRIRQMPHTKKAAAAQKPVLQRLFVSAAFYKRLKNLSAVLIHAERKFGVPLHSPDEPFIRQAYGLRQSILRDGHSRQPRRKRSHLTVKNKTEKSCATSLSVVLIIPRRAAKCKPYIGGWFALNRLSVGRVVYFSYSSRSKTVRRTMPMNTLRSSTTGTKFCSMAAFKSVGMSVVTVTAL